MPQSKHVLKNVWPISNSAIDPLNAKVKKFCDLKFFDMFLVYSFYDIKCKQKNLFVITFCVLNGNFSCQRP